MRRWLLPEYIEDILPAEAQRIEGLRRRILDLFRAHGYELVMPPLLEYLESLLTGTGHDLDLRTFKLVDQLSGRLLGVRADITPQVARIDAHLLNREGVTRLCYAGSVLHAQPSGMMRTREPLQIGAELYGHAGVESDVEIQALMVSALRAAGVGDLHVDLGHVAVFRSLMTRFGVSAGARVGAVPGAADQGRPDPARAGRRASTPSSRAALLLLPRAVWRHAKSWTQRARVFPPFRRSPRRSIRLDTIARELRGHGQEVHCFDLAELRGYHYHSGVVFAAYARARPNAIAPGRPLR